MELESQKPEIENPEEEEEEEKDTKVEHEKTSTKRNLEPSDNEVFVSVKSLKLSSTSPVSDGEGNKNKPSDGEDNNVKRGRGSRIGEGEGFHSSKLRYTEAHASFSPALKAIGFASSSSSSSSGGGSKTEGGEKGGKFDKKEIESNLGQKAINASSPVSVELGESLKEKEKESSKTGSLYVGSSGDGGDVHSEELEDVDIDLDTDLSIHVEHDVSVGNTDDFLGEEHLEEYDEDGEVVGDDYELNDQLEKLFDSDLQYDEDSSHHRRNEGRDSNSNDSLTRESRKLDNVFGSYVDSATWTQEDDMPSPLSDLSPIQSPRKKGNRSYKLSTEAKSNLQPSKGDSSSYHQYCRGVSRHHHHHSHHGGGNGGSGRSERNHHRGCRGIHQSQSNHRKAGKSNCDYSQDPFHQSQSQRHHNPNRKHPAECFTVSSQLLLRESRLYENVPSNKGERETLEALLAGGEGYSNYPVSLGSSGICPSNSASINPSTSHTSHDFKEKSSSSSNKQNGSSESTGSGSGGNQFLSHHHHHHHHHHSASNLNSNPNNSNSTEQLFLVSSDLLGPGSCIGGPPSRTSWVDSGRESLSFDGENNNSGGSSRNLLLIPPPPPPPIDYQTSYSNNCIIMQKHPHQQHQLQSPSHLQLQSQSHPHCSIRKQSSGSSRRDRLVRQKHAIDETHFLPIPTNAIDFDHGSSGGMGTHLVVPSPRRGVLSNSLIASNFAAAAASPISLQRHPPATQIMLQENKKNRPLIPCDSPYGYRQEMTTGGGGGPGMGTTEMGWNDFGSSASRGQMSRDVLRCKSPQRSRSRGKKNNQSFDYGELPSHQMFPKRHLLTSRQLGHNHPGYPVPADNGSNGSHPHENNSSAYLLQPHHQHRSFPVGLFGGKPPKSCSMGDLTSSTASPSKGHQQHHHQPHNYQSYHENGRACDQNAYISSINPSSTAPLVASLPMPPQTSITYEFSLAPQSGTLAPGWNLTAVQRGLATAVPLAAIVARKRLPRPRAVRPRFGFRDKEEARKTRFTIVATTMGLLVTCMLLVGITLRLAPLIDDLVRKENENLMRVISQTSPANNATYNQTSDFPSSTTLPPETSSSTYDVIDEDENNKVNINNPATSGRTSRSGAHDSREIEGSTNPNKNVSIDVHLTTDEEEAGETKLPKSQLTKILEVGNHSKRNTTRLRRSNLLLTSPT